MSPKYGRNIRGGGVTALEVKRWVGKEMHMFIKSHVYSNCDRVYDFNAIRLSIAKRRDHLGTSQTHRNAI